MARKTEKGGKFRNVHCRTWNMARKLKITENEKYTIYDVKYGEENEKHLLHDLKNGEITEERYK